MNRFLSVAVTLAKRAGKVQLDRLGCIKHIEQKGEINPVTEVDKMCETLIFEGLNKAFPDHDVLGEEGIAKRQKSDFCWIVDPLDGTVNYTHQFPFFGVSIALEYKKELIVGVVFDPSKRELFAAVKDKGATLNNRKIHVSSINNLKKSLLATGFAYNVNEKGRPDNLDNFAKFVKAAQALRRPGSSALDLAYVACGRFEGFWELFLAPWDMAAGVLIVREAGGRVTSFNGSAYDLYGTELLASNGLVHEDMVDILVTSDERRATSDENDRS